MTSPWSLTVRPLLRPESCCLGQPRVCVCDHARTCVRVRWCVCRVCCHEVWLPGFGMIPWTFKSMHCLVLLYDINARQSFERVEWNVRELYKLQSREGYQLERAFIVGALSLWSLSCAYNSPLTRVNRRHAHAHARPHTHTHTYHRTTAHAHAQRSWGSTTRTRKGR
jgi:hypothetical protein